MSYRRLRATAGSKIGERFSGCYKSDLDRYIQGASNAKPHAPFLHCNALFINQCIHQFLSSERIASNSALHRRGVRLGRSFCCGCWF